MSVHWELFPRQADVGVRGFGATEAEAFEQAALAMTAVVTDPARVEELTKAVFDQIDSVRTRGASDDLLARVREIARREHETSLRQNGYWLGQIGARVRDGWPLESILSYPDRVAEVEAGALREAARRYLRNDRYARFTLVPESGGGAPTP